MDAGCVTMEAGCLAKEAVSVTKASGCFAMSACCLAGSTGCLTKEPKHVTITACYETMTCCCIAKASVCLAIKNSGFYRRFYAKKLAVLFEKKQGFYYIYLYLYFLTLNSLSMTDKQENKLSMTKAVQLVLQNHAPIVSAVPAYVIASTDFDNEIDSIAGIVQVQVTQTKGKAMDKAAAENIAINAAMELIGPTKSYAMANNDNTLYETVNYSKSDLQRQRDTVLVNTLTLIRDTVQDNLAALGDYGVTAGMITTLSTAISVFSVLLATPREAISNKSAATQALVDAFKRLDPILERLDGFAELKKNSATDFYNAYKAARIIVDSGGKGKVEDTPDETNP